MLKCVGTRGLAISRLKLPSTRISHSPWDYSSKLSSSPVVAIPACNALRFISNRSTKNEASKPSTPPASASGRARSIKKEIISSSAAVAFAQPPQSIEEVSESGPIEAPKSAAKKSKKSDKSTTKSAAKSSGVADQETMDQFQIPAADLDSSSLSKSAATKLRRTAQQQQAELLFTEFRKPGYELITSTEQLQNWIHAARKKKILGIALQLSIPKRHENLLCGISLALSPGRVGYLPLPPTRPFESSPDSENTDEDMDFAHSIEALRTNNHFQLVVKNLLECDEIVKVGHNMKELLRVLFFYGVKVENFEDAQVLEYVLDCGRVDTSFDEAVQRLIAAEELQQNPLIPLKEVIGVGKKQTPFHRVSSFKAMANFANQRADFALQMYSKLKPPLLRDEQLQKLYERIELPLVRTLAEMEKEGMLVDSSVLHSLDKTYAQRISELEQQIRQEAGVEEEWNINSTRQLGEILFDKMRLGTDTTPSESKTKSGQWSVSSEVLKALADKGHKLPDLILKYRAVTKLHSTYVLGLLESINPYTGRLHTTFMNCLTQTGRLSSVDPNLQNIPIRTEEGKLLRKCFVAPQGKMILKADYSQVELRILAHVAEIPQLQEAFHTGKDVHSITASQVFGVPLDKVDKEMRRRAKAINFGIIYGMSEFGLSRQIGVTVPKAREYIDLYFRQYPGIQAYMRRTKEFVKRHGYVETVFGRRCWIPDIWNESKRSFAERTAINAPIQGSSADITKIAMNHVADQLRGHELSSKMVLQVHDELVFEAPNEEVEFLLPLIKSTMERAVEREGLQFSVPLVVDIEANNCWFTG